LQGGLHRLAKPWHALRALRVFRDETNLGAEPGLWPSIEAALSQSRFDGGRAFIERFAATMTFDY